MNSPTSSNLCPSALSQFRALLKRKCRRLRQLLLRVFLPALPVLVSLWFSALIGLSDAYLAGKMSKTALAAMGFCEPLWFLIALLTTGLCSGISVGLAAQSAPSRTRDYPAAQFFLVDSIVMSGFVGISLLCAGLFLSNLLRVHPHWLSGTAPLVSGYFLICALSNLPFAIMQAQCAIFRAARKGGNVLVLWGTVAFIEIAASNFFVRCGYLSLTTLASTLVFACLASMCVGFVLMRPLLKDFDLPSYLASSWVSHAASLRSVVRIGLPVALGELGLICGSMLNLHVISTLPDANNFEAAWAIKSRLEEALEVVPICAVGLTIAPFMGRYSGAKSKRVAKWAARMSLEAALLAACALCSVVIFVQFAAPLLVSLFCGDGVLLDETAKVVSLAAFAWPFFAVAQILFGALEGTGRTLLPTALNLVCVLPVRLGLATFLKDLPQTAGITGIAISGVLAQALLAIAIALFFWRVFPAAARARRST